MCVVQMNERIIENKIFPVTKKNVFAFYIYGTIENGIKWKIYLPCVTF